MAMLTYLSTRCFRSVAVALFAWMPFLAAQEPVAYIKTKPLQDVLGKVVNAGSQIAPDQPMVSSLPFMLGGMLGDPTLSSLSTSEPITFALYSTETMPFGYVAVAKTTPQSPIKQYLRNYNLSIKEQLGYLFISDNPDLLANVDLRTTLQIAQKQPGADIEIGIWMDRLMGLAQTYRMQFGPMLGETAGDALDLVLQEVGAVQNLMLGFNLEGDALSLQKLVVARPETALHAYFSQSLSSEVPGLAMLPAWGQVHMLYHADNDATEAYLKHLLGSVLQSFESPTLSQLNEYVASEKPLFLFDNWQVATLDFSEGILNYSQLSDTSLDAVAFGKLFAEVQAFYVSFAKQLASMNPEMEAAMAQETSFEAAALTIAELPIHRFDSPQVHPVTGEPMEMSTYLTALKGTAAMTSDTEKMERLVNILKKGLEVPDSVGKLLEAKPGRLAQFVVDMQTIVTVLQAQSGNMPEAERQAFASASAQVPQISPLEGQVTVNQGRAAFTLSLPYDVLHFFYVLGQETQAAEQADEADEMEDYSDEEMEDYMQNMEMMMP